MKIKGILAGLFCYVAVCANGQNFKPYENAILEAMAKELKTTQEYLIKDYDVKLKCEMLSSFLVEDSLTLIKQQYQKELEKQQKMIDYNRGLIEEIKNKKPRTGDAIRNGIYKTMDANSINDSNNNIKKAEEEIAKIEGRYAPIFASYESRDKKAVLFDVVKMSYTYKNPRTGAHKLMSNYAYFVPGTNKFVPRNGMGKMDALMDIKTSNK